MIPRIPLAAAAVAITLLLTACSPAAEPPTEPKTEPSSSSPAAAVPADAPSAQPAPTATVEPNETLAEPTCETIISESTVAAFGEHGWTYEADGFRLGADLVDNGIQCVWGDYTVASDHVQIFGWAPLDTEASIAAQEKLIGEGWLRADSEGRNLITEQHAFSPDEEGFGMTYEFGDGWVIVADTKQGLLLLDWQ
ncbi:hypothetical protein [Microbacterium sp. A94]|uniref:hypothetical protein n=1 Tax=Microbacterium sp. A94 TaxID=3450717 RepID=UPI003F43EA9B